MSFNRFDKTRLVEQLDAAVQLGEVHAITTQIQRVLTDIIRSGGLHLPEKFHVPQKDYYARRLLHRNPELGYTAVVMTWGPGQSTALHDHAGMWCVEGVVEGEMEVSRFNLVTRDGQRVRFDAMETLHANVGSSGNLIPPFEYHVLSNALMNDASITLHVYGGEMDHCCIYEPCENGWYLQKEMRLGYSD